MKAFKYNSKIIIACDFASEVELFNFLTLFGSRKLFLKLGMEIIYSSNFDIILKLKKLGHNIFLDLKLNDIPSTIQKAFKALNKYNVDFMTIHILSGKNALISALNIFNNTHTKLLGVSILTSLDDNNLIELGFKKSVVNTVETLINLAAKIGIHGIISSPHEAPIVKKYNLISVTPGISLNFEKRDDQQRIATPQQAARLGSDFLVVGRLITQSNNPLQTFLQIENEFNKGDT